MADGRRTLDPATRRRLEAATVPSRPTSPDEPDALAALPFALHGLTAWDRLVLDGVRTIPWGELTASYGRLAERSADPARREPSAARSVATRSA